jgi:hypothetical protein
MKEELRSFGDAPFSRSAAQRIWELASRARGTLSRLAANSFFFCAALSSRHKAVVRPFGPGSVVLESVPPGRRGVSTRGENTPASQGGSSFRRRLVNVGESS